MLLNNITFYDIWCLQHVECCVISYIRGTDVKETEKKKNTWIEQLVHCELWEKNQLYGDQENSWTFG